MFKHYAPDFLYGPNGCFIIHENIKMKFMDI